MTICYHYLISTPTTPYPNENLIDILTDIVLSIQQPYILM